MYLPNRFLRKGSHEQCKRQAYRHHLGHPRLFIACAPDELEGADLIIHAGDLTSEMDYEHLCTIAPVRAVLGNNDYYRDYGPDVDRLALFTYEGLKFAVAHYREDLPVGSVDVAINGHTHVTKEAQVGRCLVLNPGSASYPRGTRGPTMARMLVKDGKILTTKFIDLD